MVNVARDRLDLGQDEALQLKVREFLSRRDLPLHLRRLEVSFLKSYDRVKFLQTPLQRVATRDEVALEDEYDPHSRLIQTCFKNFQTWLNTIRLRNLPAADTMVSVMKVRWKGGLYVPAAIRARLQVEENAYMHQSGWYVEYTGQRFAQNITKAPLQQKLPDVCLSPAAIAEHSGHANGLHKCACEFFELACLSCQPEIVRAAARDDEVFLVVGLQKYSDLRMHALAPTAAALLAHEPDRFADFVTCIRHTKWLSNLMLLDIESSPVESRGATLLALWRRIFAAYASAVEVFAAEVVHVKPYDGVAIAGVDENLLVTLHVLAASLAGVGEGICSTLQQLTFLFRGSSDLPFVS